jgi:hypothetical protein
MEYLPTFTPKITQMQVNIPYMDHMGYINIINTISHSFLHPMCKSLWKRSSCASCASSLAIRRCGSVASTMLSSHGLGSYIYIHTYIIVIGYVSICIYYIYKVYNTLYISINNWRCVIYIYNDSDRIWWYTTLLHTIIYSGRLLETLACPWSLSRWWSAAHPRSSETGGDVQLSTWDSRKNMRG